MADAVSVAIYKLGLDDAAYQDASRRVQAASEKMADSFSRVEARINPIEAAQRRLASQILAVARAEEEGTGSEQRRAAALAQATTNFDRQVALLNRGTVGNRAFGASIQQAGFQVGDFAVQIASGTNPMRAFIQQGTQLVSMFGPWGAAIGAAGAVVGALAMSMFNLGDATDDARKEGEKFEDQYKAISDLMDKLNGKVERNRRSIEAEIRNRISLAEAELTRISASVAAIPEFENAGGTGAQGPVRNPASVEAQRKAAQEMAQQLAILGKLGQFDDGRRIMGQSHQDLIDELAAQDKRKLEEALRAAEKAAAALARYNAEIMRINDSWARASDQQANAAQSLVDKLDPVGAATRKLADDQATLLVAMANGIPIAGGYEAAMRQLEEAYQDQIDPIGALIKKQQELQDAQMSDASKTLLANLKQSGDVLENFFDQSFDRIGAGITEAFATGQIEMAKFGDIGRAIISELIQLAIQLAVINPIKNWATNGNDATIGTVFQGLQFLFNSWQVGGSVDAMIAANPTIFHGGGIVGNSQAPSRTVPMSAFANAPRFHTGGGFFGPDERPAILRKGEGVFTREQMAAMGGGGPALQIGSITINATGGTREQNADAADRIARDLRDQLDAMIDDRLYHASRSGGRLSA